MTPTTEPLTAVSIHPLLRDAGPFPTTGTSLLFAQLPTPARRADHHHYYNPAGPPLALLPAPSPGTDPVPANHSRCPSAPPLSRQPVSNAQHVPFPAADTDTHARWTPTDSPQHNLHPSNATRQPPHDCASRNPAQLGYSLLLLVRRLDSQPECPAIAEQSPASFQFSPPPCHNHGPAGCLPLGAFLNAAPQRITPPHLTFNRSVRPARACSRPRHNPTPDIRLPFTSSPSPRTALCTRRHASPIWR